MSSFFATIFPEPGTAQEAQRLVQKLDDDGMMKLVSSVVIVKGEDGDITQHGGSTPGALGAVMAGVLGGIVGLAGGPVVAAMGAAGGTLSGGWFDLLRVRDRELFMKEVAGKLNAGQAALLGEVLNPSDEAKRDAEASLTKLGGVIIGKDS